MLTARNPEDAMKKPPISHVEEALKHPDGPARRKAAPSQAAG
jgi:hypothetical protein